MRVFPFWYNHTVKFGALFRLTHSSLTVTEKLGESEHNIRVKSCYAINWNLGFDPHLPRNSPATLSARKVKYYKAKK